MCASNTHISWRNQTSVGYVSMNSDLMSLHENAYWHDSCVSSSGVTKGLFKFKAYAQRMPTLAAHLQIMLRVLVAC